MGTHAIVICTNGWVFCVRVDRIDDTGISYVSGCVVRRWGTTNGIGQLSNGPLTETVFDKIPNNGKIWASQILNHFNVEGWEV